MFLVYLLLYSNKTILDYGFGIKLKLGQN